MMPRSTSANPAMTKARHTTACRLRPERGRHLLAAMLLASIASTTQAEPGRLRLGIELEHERAAGGNGHADSLTLIPGIKWEQGWLTMGEILLQAGREDEHGETSSERKLGLRLRKDLALAPGLKVSLRGLLGRAFATERNVSYAYIEPAFKYRIQVLEWTVGVRAVRSIDGSKGQDRNKFRFGPSLELSPRDEIEFRWVRSWDTHSGKRDSDAGIVEYVRKF